VCSSAGKNTSVASSATVTSTGVPKTVIVLNSDSSPSPWRRRNGTTSPDDPSVLAAALRSERELGDLGEVHDLAGEPVGMECDAKQVRSRGQHRRVQPAHEHTGAAVGEHDVAQAVDHDGWPRIEAVEDLLQGGAHRCHVAVVQAGLGVAGRVPGGEQQVVALAQRHVQAVGEEEHHLRARARAAGLDEAQVAR
jgi:hypothetical protein